MRVLVCGGRDFEDTSLLEDVLSDVYWSLSHEEQQSFVLIEGGARGADRLARNFLMQTLGLDPDYHLATYPALWTIYGKKAGPIRNQQMLDEGKPDLVVAFPGGKGTADMVCRARAAGVEVKEIS